MLTGETFSETAETAKHFADFCNFCLKGFHVPAVRPQRFPRICCERCGNLFCFSCICRGWPGFPVWPTWEPFSRQRRGNLFAQQTRGNLFGAVEGLHVSAMSGQTDVRFTADMWKPFGNEERFLRVCCRRGSSLPHSLMTSTGVVYNNGRDVETFREEEKVSTSLPWTSTTSSRQRRGNLLDSRQIRGNVSDPRQRRGNLLGPTAETWKPFGG